MKLSDQLSKSLDLTSDQPANLFAEEVGGGPSKSVMEQLSQTKVRGRVVNTLTAFFKKMNYLKTFYYLATVYENGVIFMICTVSFNIIHYFLCQY